jgi:starvation-inducible DNA-binding protein
MKNLEEALKIAVGTEFHWTAKVHLAHFNITGPRFYEIHKLLELIYKSGEDSFDGIGEELRALDIFAPSDPTRLLELSVLPVQQMILPAQEMIHELLLDNDRLIKTLETVNALSNEHLGLQNFVQGLIDIQEKYAWFLRSTIKGR